MPTSRKPVNPNDDMQLEVVDDDDELGLRNAVRNSSVATESDRTQSTQRDGDGDNTGR